MKKLTTLILSMAFASGLNAQSPAWLWAKALGGTDYDVGNSVAVDASGNVYTTGYFNETVDFDPGPGTFFLSAGTSGGYADVFISKLDASGNFVWAKAFSGTDDEYASDIALDASGNIYTAGYFGGTVDFNPGAGTFNLTSSGFGDFFISKLDNSGNFIWAKQFTASNIFYDEGSLAIDFAGNGNVYSAGQFSGTVDFDPGPGVFNLTAVGSKDMFISKLDSSGNFLWAKAMSGSGGNNEIHSIAIDPSGSGDVYACGTYDLSVDFDPGSGVFNISASGTDYDIFICKLDSAGNFAWAKSMNGTSNGVGESIVIDPAGSGALYITGFFWSTADFDPGAGVYNLTPAGLDDIFILKLDASGNFIRARAIGGTDFDGGSSLAFDHSGNGAIYMTGFFSGTADFNPDAGVFNLTSTGENDLFISKYDSSGNFVWAGAGGTDYDEGYSIALDPGGHGYISGYFDSPTISFGSSTLTTAGFSDILVAKFDTVLVTGINNLSVSSNVVSVFPNPFSGSTTISFSLYRSEIVSLNIFDVNGRLVKSLVDGELSKGNHKIEWNAAGVEAGIYFLKMETATFSENQKLIVTK